MKGNSGRYKRKSEIKTKPVKWSQRTVEDDKQRQIEQKQKERRDIREEARRMLDGERAGEKEQKKKEKEQTRGQKGEIPTLIKIKEQKRKVRG